MLLDEFSRVVKGLDYVTEDRVEELLDVILEQVKSDLHATAADIVRSYEDREGKIILRSVAAIGRQTEKFDLSIGADSKGMLACAIRTEEPIWIEEIQKHSNSKNSINNLAKGKPIQKKYCNFIDWVDSLIIVPAHHNRKMRGLLRVQSHRPQGFSKSDLEVLFDLARPIGALLWKLSTSTENSIHTREAISSFQKSVKRSKHRLNPYRTGFIARPFNDECGKVAKILKSALEGRCVRAKEYIHPEGARIVIEEMADQISTAHFGVVDLTGLSPNVLVEFGMILGSNRPFFLLCQDGEQDDLPFDLRGFNVYRYKLNGNRMLFRDAGSSDFQQAEEPLSKFVDNILMTDEAFETARQWRPDRLSK